MCPKKCEKGESCGDKKSCSDKSSVGYMGGGNKQNGGTRNDIATSGKIMFGLVEKQIEGFSADELVKQPGGVKNHAIWNMGHIALTMDGVLGLLGHQKTLDEKWKTLFGGGSQPVADASAYPSAAELKEKMITLHAKASEAFLNAPSELLRSQNPNERFRAMAPTLGGMVVFLMSAHLGEHVGQISAWRRAMGKDPIF
jgi:hypothetical protein